MKERTHIPYRGKTVAACCVLIKRLRLTGCILLKRVIHKTLT